MNDSIIFVEPANASNMSINHTRNEADAIKCRFNCLKIKRIIEAKKIILPKSNTGDNNIPEIYTKQRIKM